MKVKELLKPINIPFLVVNIYLLSIALKDQIKNIDHEIITKSDTEKQLI